jgi:hypothetical protein
LHRLPSTLRVTIAHQRLKPCCKKPIGSHVRRNIGIWQARDKSEIAANDANKMIFDAIHAVGTNRASPDAGSWSASVNGGDERPVTEMSSQGWVPARSGIYFIDGSPPHFSLGYFDFVTWHARKIADLPGLFIVWGPTLSPDGHTVLFTGREHSESDIFLVEGFR